MVYTRKPCEGRHFCLNSANSHRDWPPEPGILVSVVTFEAMQLPGVSKVATLTWMGHGFGLRRAQLLTLNPKPFHIVISKHLNPKRPTAHTTGGGAGANPNPKPNTHHHTTGFGEGIKH